MSNVTVLAPSLADLVEARLPIVGGDEASALEDVLMIASAKHDEAMNTVARAAALLMQVDDLVADLKVDRLRNLGILDDSDGCADWMTAVKHLVDALLTAPSARDDEARDRRAERIAEDFRQAITAAQEAQEASPDNQARADVLATKAALDLIEHLRKGVWK